MKCIRLPAEWEEQDGVLMAWPHETTDWAPLLHQARETFARVIAAASHHARVLVITPTTGNTRHYLRATDAIQDRITLIPAQCNDTWTRDFGPITIMENGHPALLDFQFTGWGGKFPAHLDNALSRDLKERGVFGHTPLRPLHLVLEGGSIDSDGHGALLTTTSCNANPNRNARLTPAEIEQAFRQFLGVSRILWLHHGYLAGDDTDGHIDMLARFAPHDTLVYQSCDDPNDEHFQSLAAMARELQSFTTPAGNPYRLLPLPWPSARYDENGHRLPASYANFLALNTALLAPVYGDRHDAAALHVLRQAFPHHAVTGIDCSTLIRQHGSLHCITMQLPWGVLS